MQTELNKKSYLFFKYSLSYANRFSGGYYSNSMKDYCRGLSLDLVDWDIMASSFLKKTLEELEIIFKKLQPIEISPHVWKLFDYYPDVIKLKLLTEKEEKLEELNLYFPALFTTDELNENEKEVLDELACIIDDNISNICDRFRGIREYLINLSDLHPEKEWKEIQEEYWEKWRNNFVRDILL